MNANPQISGLRAKLARRMLLVSVGQPYRLEAREYRRRSRGACSVSRSRLGN
jgi:hypothetical protein